MENIYNNIKGALDREDREAVLRYCKEYLEKGQIDIIELYESILGPVLNEVVVEYGEDDELLIWKEHIRSGIIKHTLENLSLYVMEEKKSLDLRHNKRAFILCPKFEDHEIGARMVCDFLIILGFDVKFLGGNTPEKTIIRGIKEEEVDYILISVTNYYNMINTKKTIEEIRSIKPNIKIILGGNAFKANKSIYRELGGDYMAESFADLYSIVKGEKQNEISI